MDTNNHYFTGITQSWEMEGIPHSLVDTVYIPNKNVVRHYTCNPPSEQALSKHKIVPIGKNFGCDNNGVLLIPESVFTKFGRPLTSHDPHYLTIISEQILRDLSKGKQNSARTRN